MQSGWSIWEWPSIFVEAKHRAVYAPPGDAAWIDVTPAPDGETRRVFLPDDTTTYDFDAETVGREPPHAAGDRSARGSAVFALAAPENRIRAAIPGIGEVSVPVRVAVELQCLSDAKALVIRKIGLKCMHQHQPCFWGSDEKFKRCCGR
ncbi:hypothetical protein [Methylobacterium trifolii]|uniref:Uncharacterized protein n=1 Tax=Methylobacterium trifolii TaxID=1003092 RepID=A0ABQ4U596_9HYPH|nr:hypothetical protein [Methylobacterium trifolii]GJE60980.1 hypothetical protein MPOCJGCO_3099 [Methylobacterium trifolii]